MVFDVVLGRLELSLGLHLKDFSDKENAQFVVMDLSDSYPSIVRRYLSNGIIVSDRFHVIRLINQHLLKAWQGCDPEGRKHRVLSSLMLRHQWRPRDEQRENRVRYLDDYSMLQALYTAKQQLNRLLLVKSLNRKKSKQLLPQLLSLIEDLAASSLHRLARTLKSRLEPITGMCRFTKTNGITVGFHNKMEVMSRRDYGSINFENYRLRVLTHCGWDGIINRV